MKIRIFRGSEKTPDFYKGRKRIIGNSYYLTAPERIWCSRCKGTAVQRKGIFKQGNRGCFWVDMSAEDQSAVPGQIFHCI